MAGLKRGVSELGQGELWAIAHRYVPRQEQLWLIGLMALPYTSYAGLALITSLYVAALVQRGDRIGQLCAQRGFGWLSAGLVLSASFGLNRSEAFLQLTNFLPFFLLFGVLATVPALALRPFAQLETLARWLLIASMPMTVWAIAEFIFKFEAIAPRIRAAPLPDWLLTRIYEPDFGHRARSVFGHPNALSAYLVIVLGLGLGLILKGLAQQSVERFLKQKMRSHRFIETIAVALALAAIFCTGSRNGLLIAGVLVAIALYCARRHYWVMLSGLVGLGAIIAAVVSLGIGGRSLSLALLTEDPRIGVWQLAIAMIQQRPGLGWGFAGLRSLYIPDSIPGYSSIAHAHNVWLFLASETGIPIMLGFCIVIGSIYYGAIKAFVAGGLPIDSQAILLGYLLAFTSCLLFGLFDVVLFDARLNILTWGLLASLYVISHSKAVKLE